MRCIGSALRIYNLADSSLVDTGIRKIAKHLENGVPKTKWNAAHAASNVFNNPLLYDKVDLKASVLTLIDSLLRELQESSNFKVRINASQAIECLAVSGFMSTELDFLAAMHGVIDAAYEKIVAEGDDARGASSAKPQLEYRYVAALQETLLNCKTKFESFKLNTTL